MPTSSIHGGSDEIIRPSTRDDIAGLIALFAEVFGEERATALWEWKYFEHPRGAFSMLCEANGRIVAHCGGTPVVVRDGAREYLALQSVDFMSSAKHAGGLAGGGVFARTVKRFFDLYCGERGALMVYGFPGERHRLFGERVLRYKPIEPVGELSLEPHSDAGASLEPLHPAKLALLSHSSTGFGAVRDESYLLWRYVAHPLHRYQAISIDSWFGGRLTAIVRRTASEVLLMEVLGHDSVKNVRKLVDALRALGAPVRAWGSPTHPRTARLIDAGFALRERDHLFEYRYFIPRSAPQPGEFYYSLGDYDVY